MRKSIYDERGDVFIRAVEAEPECGKNFCDSCGDCLHCYPGECIDRSGETGEHRWVQYGEQPAG